MLPPRAVAYIDRGAAGQEPETAKSGEACFSRTQTVIIGGLGQALAAARDKAALLGYSAGIIDAQVRGEAREAARTLAGMAREIQQGMQPGERRCLLFGGETTVTVSGRGKGGRNQELALAFALEIAGTPGITLLSAGTDGTDGPTDAAGGVVDGETVKEATRHGLFPGDYLANNDSYTFFQRFDAATGVHAHFKTGPTGTNVMDMQIIVLER
jgi:glycerate-2-kinase